MPDLSFDITSASASERGLTPMLSFGLAIMNRPPDQRVQSIILQVQVRIEPLRRAYDAHEREDLRELFGPSARLGPTMQDMVLAHAAATVPVFRGRTRIVVEIPCTFDLNVATAKYLYGLGSGEVPLLFLFSGTVIYEDGGRMLIQPISWDCECRFRMPVATWKDLIDAHYPDSGWIYLQRDVFDRLIAYRRRNGFASWEQAIGGLLANISDGPPGASVASAAAQPSTQDDTHPSAQEETRQLAHETTHASAQGEAIQ